MVPLDESGALLRKHSMQLEGLGVRDLHFSDDDLYILAGPTMVLDGEIPVFKWSGAKSLLAANREAARFETALTESVSLPHGRGINRAEALCKLPPGLVSGKPSWLVLYDAPGAEIARTVNTPSLAICCATIKAPRKVSSLLSSMTGTGILPKSRTAANRNAK
jgi:hypothetical protein